MTALIVVIALRSFLETGSDRADLVPRRRGAGAPIERRQASSMSDLIVLPTVLPALTAAFLLLAMRYDLKRQRIDIGRRDGGAARARHRAIPAGRRRRAAFLSPRRLAGAVRHRARARPAVGDDARACRRSRAVLSSVYAVNGWDRARAATSTRCSSSSCFGINGAFLTGDVFNLFVFFEVMLIASYGLLLHGGGPRAAARGISNTSRSTCSASTLFLFAVGLIYAVVGTLNMAELAVKAPLVARRDAALLRTGVLLLFLVFAIKAALVPLHWWLPATYAAASAPVAALFMIMTKIGVYAMLRRLRHRVRVRRRAARRHRRAVDIAGRARDRCDWHDRHPGEPDAARPRRLRGRRVDGHGCWIAVGLLGCRPASRTALYYLVHSTLAARRCFWLSI